MSAGTVVSVLLAASTVAFVLAPLFRKDAAEAEKIARAESEAMELLSQKDMALAALKDLDDDRDTGKIDDRDYRELHTRLTTRAVDVMKRLDALEADHDEAR